MAQPVTVYRWDDPGAPQLVNRTPSEIIDILKKCLVDGYGSKTPLGWTKPYEDAGNYKVVFRNSIADGGSGGYVQVRSSDGSNATNRSVLLTPAKSANDVDSLVQPGYIKSFGLATNWTTWVLIGTSIGFYFIAGIDGRVLAAYNVSARDTSMYIGDFDSLLPNDAGRFIVLAKPTTSDDVIETISASNSHNLCEAVDNLIVSPSSIRACRIYDADNFDAARNYTFGFTGPGASRGAGSAISGSQLEKSRALFMRPALVLTNWSYTNQAQTDRLGALLTQSDVYPAIRGFLPGFIYEMVARYTTETWPITEELNGQQHWLLCMSFGRMAGHWINMEEW